MDISPGKYKMTMLGEWAYVVTELDRKYFEFGGMVEKKFEKINVFSGRNVELLPPTTGGPIHIFTLKSNIL